MRDERRKEERSKQGQTNKQGKSTQHMHPRQSLFLRKMSCLRWDSNPRYSHDIVIIILLFLRNDVVPNQSLPTPLQTIIMKDIAESIHDLPWTHCTTARIGSSSDFRLQELGDMMSTHIPAATETPTVRLRAAYRAMPPWPCTNL